MRWDDGRGGISSSSSTSQHATVAAAASSLSRLWRTHEQCARPHLHMCVVCVVCIQSAAQQQRRAQHTHASYINNDSLHSKMADRQLHPNQTLRLRTAVAVENERARSLETTHKNTALYNAARVQPFNRADTRTHATNITCIVYHTCTYMYSSRIITIRTHSLYCMLDLL